MKTDTKTRLAKNSLYMYVRMIVLMTIAFLTTRVLLQKLGVTDFGIYNLIGSILAMFSSLRALFITSTQRFLNYELGRGDSDNLKMVFNTSILVNIFISILYALFVELLGLWFISNEINIPEDRISDAFVVLHISVATSIVYIMTTPYDALIIAHEKISSFAYFTIIDHLLKLLIIYLLYMSENKMVLYAAILFWVGILMHLSYLAYCYKSFNECRFNLKTNRDCLMKMLSFAGWQFFGNTAFTLTHNGLNMILNVYGGPIVNAARTIAYQVNQAINQLIVNMALVISPFSVKSFASNNYKTMFDLFFLSSKLMFTVTCCAIIPLVFFTDVALEIWLGSTPDYASNFVKIILFWAVLRALHSPIDTLFKSVGKIKEYQLSEGVLLSLPVFVSLLALKMNASLYVVFVLVILFELLNLLNIVRIAKSQCNLDMGKYLHSVLLPCLGCMVEIIAIDIFSLSFIRHLGIVLLVAIVTEICVIFTTIKFCLTPVEKSKLLSLKKNLQR